MTKGGVSVDLQFDGKELHINLSGGSTVEQAINQAQVVLGEMDRVEPSLSSIVSDGLMIKITRVSEEYYIEQAVIPFEHQELVNEALPEGDRRISQPGINGLKEITYHRLYEDGVVVSTDIVNATILKESIPEVVMIGSKKSLADVAIRGKIAYLSTGNAWLMENSTANRELIVSTGDLDGRVFSLSKNGEYLLFTRFSNHEQSINSLWIALLGNRPARIIDMGVENIAHFAEFDPSSSQVAYSTVEWRDTAPGWQANNNLYVVSIGIDGSVGSPQLIQDSNSGGYYGWWGTNFAWAPDGNSMLFTRPDGIGILNIPQRTSMTLLNIIPFQTKGDWAWIPPAAWSPDGKMIYTIDHQSLDIDGSNQTDRFDLVAIPSVGGLPLHLISDVGMFSYPTPSPVIQSDNFINSSSQGSLPAASFSLAFLRAIAPSESDKSLYQLATIDRDGSNYVNVYPESGTNGLDPQHIAWSAAKDGEDKTIAFIYQQNIWFINPETGTTQQITGDGLVNRIDWR